MTARSQTLPAHAKINLVLHVLEREPTGFHQIETLFQRLALADTVTVRTGVKTHGLDIAWEGMAPIALGPVQQNLVWRAAVAYRDVAGWPGGWSIELTKRIPAGAGLGGGSSDAAATLLALDALAPRTIGRGKLLELAATLGSDVPFFASGDSLAIGRGRGERLLALPSLPPAGVLLTLPPYPVSTADAYATLDRLRGAEPRKSPAHPIAAPEDVGTWSAIAKRQVNDFEESVFAQHADLREARAWLEREGAAIARLSGSGSTVFGLWPDDPAPELAPPRHYQLLATKTA